eukprot:scaffold668691_cov43-Prasinocladus_malaysianus.AAC.1
MSLTLMAVSQHRHAFPLWSRLSFGDRQNKDSTETVAAMIMQFMPFTGVHAFNTLPAGLHIVKVKVTAYIVRRLVVLAADNTEACLSTDERLQSYVQNSADDV